MSNKIGILSLVLTFIGLIITSIVSFKSSHDEEKTITNYSKSEKGQAFSGVEGNIHINNGIKNEKN